MAATAANKHAGMSGIKMRVARFAAEPRSCKDHGGRDAALRRRQCTVFEE